MFTPRAWGKSNPCPRAVATVGNLQIWGKFEHIFVVRKAHFASMLPPLFHVYFRPQRRHRPSTTVRTTSMARTAPPLQRWHP
jgi:hypothetical protein